MHAEFSHFLNLKCEESLPDDAFSKNIFGQEEDFMKPKFIVGHSTPTPLHACFVYQSVYSLYVSGIARLLFLVHFPFLTCPSPSLSTFLSYLSITTALPWAIPYTFFSS